VITTTALAGPDPDRPPCCRESETGTCPQHQQSDRVFRRRGARGTGRAKPTRIPPPDTGGDAA